MKDILKYFDALNEDQIRKIEQLHDLYLFWNEKINLISRKEMPYLYPRHILHSLSIARVFDFAPNTKIIDIGTGGGLPGLPLAIYFPQVQFHLVDSIGKKIKVVNELIKSGIDGIEVFYGRHDFYQVEHYESLCRKHNLFMSGGSDFHGNDPDYVFMKKLKVPHEKLMPLLKRTGVYNE